MMVTAINHNIDLCSPRYKYATAVTQRKYTSMRSGDHICCDCIGHDRPKHAYYIHLGFIKKYIYIFKKPAVTLTLVEKVI